MPKSKNDYEPLATSDSKTFFPADKPAAEFDGEKSTISYTDPHNQLIVINSKDIAEFLKQRRDEGTDGWGYAAIFQNIRKDKFNNLSIEEMTHLAEFEASLNNTHALLDYWLLRLGGKINELNQSKFPTEDLSHLYHALKIQLDNFESILGALTTRHHNDEKEALTEDFKQNWQNSILPLVTKYQQHDWVNILKNLAFACTGVGLIVTIAYGAARTYRGDNFLFQYEGAHSRKRASLQKLNDVMKDYAPSAETADNFFSLKMDDAEKSLPIFQGAIEKLDAFLNSQETPNQYYDNLGHALDTFKRASKNFSNYLGRLKNQREGFMGNWNDYEATKLKEYQINLMDEWTTAVTTRVLKDNAFGEAVPEELSIALQEIMDIYDIFKRQISQFKDSGSIRAESSASSLQSDLSSSDSQKNSLPPKSK